MDSPSTTLPDPLPVAVFPIHDPDGWMLEHRRAMTPQLKALFARAVVSVSARTSAGADELAGDPFFDVVRNPEGTDTGTQFLAGYRRAAELCPPEQPLHLCFEHRLAFALESEHREAFLADLRLARGAEHPILFQRSAWAWRTHPQTYYAVESMATRVGEILLGRSLDFAWCYLAVRAGRLGEVLPGLEGIRDMSILAAIVLALKDELVTQEVDWLAWEKPFILGRDPDEARAAWEHDPADHEKRLAYTIPAVRLLLAEATKR